MLNETNEKERYEISPEVQEEIKRVDSMLTDTVDSRVGLINKLSNHIFSSGGKRIRPLLVLLSAKAAGYSGKDHIIVAVILELIHTATLLHDDVVDDSKLRRGKDTANVVWGNEASVLVGDFLYSKAFQIMVNLDNKKVLSILAEATNTLAEGEIMQLIDRRNPMISEERYLATINSKTAKLFESASALGAVTAKSSKPLEIALSKFGKHLGSSFQLIDDALDYNSDANILGKNIGDDLAEGKPTLPLLYAMWKGNVSQKTMIQKAIQQGGLDNLEEIIEIIQLTGGIEYTMSLANEEAKKARAALSQVPESIYKRDLLNLLQNSVSRKS